MSRFVPIPLMMMLLAGSVALAEDDFLPTPYTAEQIRDEWQPGLELTTHDTTPEGESWSRTTVREASTENVSFAVVPLDADLEPIGEETVGLVGLTFKQGTDDLRESPTLRLIDLLLGRGLKVRVFDRQIGRGEDLLGQNRHILEDLVARHGNLLCSSINELIGSAGIVIFTNSGQSELAEARKHLRKDQHVFSLEAASGEFADLPGFASLV